MIAPAYRATLLCTLPSPSSNPLDVLSATPSSNPLDTLSATPLSSSLQSDSLSTPLHLQASFRGTVRVTGGDGTPFTPLHEFIHKEYPQWFQSTTSSQVVTDLGRMCESYDTSHHVYVHQDTPHFVEMGLSGIEEASLLAESDLKVDHAVFATCDSIPRYIDSNEVERELEQTQEDLFQTMCENDKALATLIIRLAAAEPASDETLRLIDTCKQLQVELQDYTFERRPELIHAEEEEENDAICEVCGDGNSDFGNMILFCDGCNAAVHQGCYDVTTLPKGDWFCNVCEDILMEKLGVTDLLHLVPKETTVNESSENDWESVSSCPILDRLHELRSQVYCCICGYSKGAMMPTLEPGKYAHVCCALWHPEVRVTNSHPLCSRLHRVPLPDPESTENPINEDTILIPLPNASTSETVQEKKERYELVPSPYAHLRSHMDQNRYLVDISEMKPQRKNTVCQLCRRRSGAVPCCCSGCSRHVHASCALRYELDLFWNNKVGHSGAPLDELLVEKDFFIHCFHHSGGCQGRDVPHKRAEGYKSPIGENHEVTIGRRRKNEDQGYIATPTGRRRSRRQEGLEASQAQGLERLRKKRERKQKKRERLNNAGRRKPRVQPLAFTTKPRARYEVALRRVVEWLRDSRCGPLLLDDSKNVILQLQRRIDLGELPRYSEWYGFTAENATIQSFFARCQHHQFFNLESIVTEIRVIYINLLAYLYLSQRKEEQELAAMVAKDALDLTCFVTRITDTERYRQMLKQPETFYCLCAVKDGESQEYMVCCDGCLQWFHPFCIGYAETKYLNYLTTYGGKFVEVSEGKSFYCPKCYVGENANKVELLTEEEVIARGAVRLEVVDETESQETANITPTPIMGEENDHDEKRVKTL